MSKYKYFIETLRKFFNANLWSERQKKEGRKESVNQPIPELSIFCWVIEFGLLFWQHSVPLFRSEDDNISHQFSHYFHIYFHKDDK